MTVELATKEDVAKMFSEFEQRLLAVLKAPQSAKAEKQTFTLKAAADYIGVKPRKLGDLVRAKEIPHVRFGKEPKFLKSDLDNYLFQHRVSSSAELESVANNR